MNRKSRRSFKHRKPLLDQDVSTFMSILKCWGFFKRLRFSIWLLGWPFALVVVLLLAVNAYLLFINLA